MTIVNVGYRSTNYWVITEGKSRLLVDLGWPGMAGALFAELNRKNIPFGEIRYGLATHFHMDHAGAAQDLKNKGMRLVVAPEQVPWIEPMKQWMKAEHNYTPIALGDNVVVSIGTSRKFLASTGFQGELVYTPGHSDDSVSLVLDSGDAFTGDLTLPVLATEEQLETVTQSWQALRDRGARRIHGGHGPVWDLKNS